MLPRSLWDLFLQFLGKTPHLKNGSQIDPDGARVAPVAPTSDNRGTIDPNGASAPENDNHGTIDPNG